LSCTTQLLSDDAYRVQDLLYLAVLLVLHLRHVVQDQEDVGGHGRAPRCGRHLCCSAATRRTAATAAAVTSSSVCRYARESLRLRRRRPRVHDLQQVCPYVGLVDVRPRVHDDVGDCLVQRGLRRREDCLPHMLHPHVTLQAATQVFVDLARERRHAVQVLALHVVLAGRACQPHIHHLEA